MDIIDGFLKLIFPENVSCFVCLEPACADEYGLCESCREKIRPAEVTQSLPFIAGVTAGAAYDEILRTPMHRLKYGGAQYVARNLARFINIPEDWAVTCLLPVPLHKNRMKERGYNQSAIIASCLSKKYNIPVYCDMLRRLVDTPTQTILSGEERVKNVENAFIASRKIKGHTPLLIDDVLTTGSTLNACARALIEAGSAEVYVAVACAAI